MILLKKKDRIIYVANLTKAEEVFANLKKNSQVGYSK